MESLIGRYVREREDVRREKRGEPPLTDEQAIDLMLALKYFRSAHELLDDYYAQKEGF